MPIEDLQVNQDRAGSTQAPERRRLKSLPADGVAEQAPAPRRAGRRATAGSDSAALFEHVVRGWDRVLLYALLLTWAASVTTFWLWWTEPVHQVSTDRFVLDSILLGYITVVLPLLPVIFLSRARRVNPAHALPEGRVAMVVTKAPSEPWSLVSKTLEAMRNQDYPHPYDIWLCDENPAPATAAWCVLNDVRLSTRRGVAEYQRLTWPRREKCKEGNLAYFYDHWGYEDYDLVVQLDADHVPAPSYLTEMMRPFASPRVGYVAAPSICDSNASMSWAARGRLWKEANLHGPSQAGCNDGFAPVCIGSHYAVRTAALREIGGIGPELAEDFTTSLLMNVGGWQGAFALDAEAHGEGPPTFAALLVQEFQWSQSLMSVMFDIFPRRVGALPWRLRIRFILALIYYPMLALTTIGALSMVPIAAVTGEPWMKVNYVEFVIRGMLISAPLLGATILLRRRRILRPANAKLISWEIWLFSLTRWPWVAWGILVALKLRVWPKQTTFKVTPKGDHGLTPLPFRLVGPYLGVSALAAGAALERSASSTVHGYVLLSLLAAATYLLVTALVIGLHAHETRRYVGATWKATFPTVRGPLVGFAGVTLLFAAATTSVFHL